MIDYMASAGPHISVKVDEVLNIAGVSMTNSHLMGFLGLIVLVWAMFRTRAAVLGKKINQHSVEFLVRADDMKAVSNKFIEEKVSIDRIMVL